MKIFWIIVVILAVLFGGWWLANQPEGMNLLEDIKDDDGGAPVSGENGSNVSGSEVGGASEVNTAPDEELIGFEVETQAFGEELEQTNLAGATVVYTDNGFSPASVTIALGQTIIFRNQSSADFWPASAQHPTHEVYPGSGLAKCSGPERSQIFDACQGVVPGGTYSFQFNQKGTWNYHNHLFLGRFGTVIVE